MKDNNSNGFVPLLCTFMVILLFASVFLGSGRRFYTVVDDLYGYCAGVVDLFEVGGLTDHLSVKPVGCVYYGTSSDLRMYFVFEYPQTLPRFVKNINLYTRRTPSRYVARFHKTTDASGKVVYTLDGIGTSRSNSYNARNVFGNLKSEEDFIRFNEYLTNADLVSLGLYNISYDGKSVFFECEFGSYAFNPVNMGDGYAGGR